MRETDEGKEQIIYMIHQHFQNILVVHGKEKN